MENYIAKEEDIIMEDGIMTPKNIQSRATSGTVSNAFRTGYKVQAVWSVNSQNVANNTSNVTVKVQLCSTGSSYSINASATKNGSVTINGTKYSFTFNASVSGNQTKTVYTKTVDIPHNSDGTKSFNLSATLGIAVTLSGTYWGDVTCSGTGTLNSIPRTSSFTLSASSIGAGNAITVNINRASTAFTHKVFYSFGSNTATISTNATTSASYTIPLSHLNAIPNSTSGTATISVDTYNGSTYIGSASKNFTITAPSSVKPTFTSVTATIVANGADTSYGYVKGKSKCKLTINGASGSNGSTIKSYSISGGGFSSTASSFTTGALTSSGTITFTAKVTDSRGRTSDSKTVSISVLDYMNPNITSFKVIRCNSGGTADDDGTYIKITPKYTYSTLNNKNSITSKAEFRATGASSWTNAGAVASGSSLVTGSNGIATDKSYDVRLTITDKFTSVSQSVVVPTAFVTMDIKKGGKGIAFGKGAETDNLLDIGIDTRFRGSVKNKDGLELMSRAKKIPANANLNDYRTEGFYYSPANADASTMSNVPSTQAFSLLVERHAGCKQTFTCYQTGDRRTWIRNYYDGSWSGWTMMFTQANPPSWSEVSGKPSVVTAGATIGTLYLTDWVRTKGTTGWYSQDYGGGWHMSDSTWLRSYNGKSIYAGSGTIKTEGTVVCNVLDDRVGASNSCYVDNANGGNSQITLRPDTDNKGNLGHKNYTWNYANITSIGNTFSIDRETSYNVSSFDDNDMMYDMVKNMNFYLEKEKSVEEFEEEIELKKTEEYINADEETQKQMLRNIEKVTPASYYYSKRTKLVANAEELPFLVAPESHVSNGSKTIEIGSLVAGLACALQKSIQKIEELENKIEELENR